MSLNKKEDFKGEIAKTIELAEETKDPREMMKILIRGDKEEFLSQQHARKMEITKERNDEKYDFSDLLEL